MTERLVKNKMQFNVLQVLAPEIGLKE